MRYFNLHTHQFSGDGDSVELVNQYPHEFNAAFPYYSIGIHPWHIEEARVDSDLAIIEENAVFEQCGAIGECGLDKRIDTPVELQVEVFKKQLALAENLQKPVIIHCVAAFQEIIEIKNQLEISVPMIVHGFSKNAQTAKQLIDNGFYLSFGKYLLRNPELESVFKEVPNGRFFLETDMVEETIGDVYELAAQYKGISVNELKEMTADNVQHVFGIAI